MKQKNTILWKKNEKTVEDMLSTRYLNRKKLADFFYPLYQKMLLDNIIQQSDFSIKSKWRLFKLYGLKGLK